MARLTYCILLFSASLAIVPSAVYARSRPGVHGGTGARRRSLTAADYRRKWHQYTERYIKQTEALRESRPVAYPQLTERFRTLFRGRGVTHIRIFTEQNGQRRLGGELYYRSGELHVIQHVEGWNLVTRGGSVYEWEVGKKQGWVIPTKVNDLVDYLVYLTDPSFIMTALYQEYLTHPDQFQPPVKFQGDCIQVTLKNAEQPFRTLLVREKPLWFCGLDVESPAKEHPATTSVRYSPPETVPEVPREVFDRLKGVKFRKSNESIRRLMVFL